MKRTCLAILPLLSLPLLGALAAAPAQAAPAQSVEVSSAVLVARGAGVDVTLVVTCPADSQAHLNVNVAQRSGNRIARGFGYTSITCTGAPQTATVRAAAEGAAFRTGEALVTADLTTCGPDVCQSSQTSSTVRITRR